MEIINSQHYNLSKRKKEFFDNKPFPYLVLDDFIEKNFFNDVSKKILNKYTLTDGKSFNSEIETNKTISLNESLPKYISQITDVLNSDKWLESLKY